MAEKSRRFSLYVYCSNNPINRIDPDGMLDDRYTVDEDGYVKLEEKTDDQFDNLYTKEDYDKGDLSKGIQVNDKSILPSLAGESNFENQVYPDLDEKTRTIYFTNENGKREMKVEKIKTMIDGHYAETTSKNDAKNVFKFAASNSNVEWSINGNNERKWAVGTLHRNAQAPTFDNLGDSYSSKNVIYDAHSHPGNTTIDFRPSNNDMNRAVYQKQANPNSSTWLFMPKNPTTRWLKLK